MRSPESVANTRRFFARSHAPRAQAGFRSNALSYSAQCFLWDTANTEATPAERDQAHRAIARKCGV